MMFIKYFAILLVLFLLSACGNNSQQITSSANQEDNKKIDSNLLAKNYTGDVKTGALENLKGEKLPADNMYQSINVGGQDIKIPAAWKENWDYVMNNCREDLCKVFGQLGNEYVSYCKKEVDKKCKTQVLQNGQAGQLEQSELNTGSIQIVGTGGDALSGQIVDNQNQDCSKIKKYEDKLACYMTKVFDEKNKSKSCKQIIPSSEKRILLECIKAKIIYEMIQKNDIKICDKLSKAKDSYNECRNVYYDKNAFDKKDSKLCDKITDEEMKKACKERIKSVK